MKSLTLTRPSIARLIVAATLFLGCLFSASHAAERPHVLLICVDDLRPELGCYGADYIASPNIDRFAQSATLFRRHYVQAPTCGASRSALLTGRYGGGTNDALFQRAKRMKDGHEVPVTLPAWFRQHGYVTVSVGKVSHHPGGMGGPDWNDASQLEMPASWDRNLLPAGPWQHPRGWMHGLAGGEIRLGKKTMDVFQSVQGDDSLYPDGESIEESLRQLDQLSNDSGQPFFLAVGVLRPHLPFGAPAKYMAPYRDVDLPPIRHPEKPAGRTTWHRSGEFHRYDLKGKDPNVDGEFADQVRKHYAACVSYADAQVGKLLDRLRQSPAADNTIVILWGDHGWHLGEHAVWGKHTLFEESLHAPLIIQSPSSDVPGSRQSHSDAMVESIDVFPTVCELAGIPTPESTHGTSLVPMLASSSSGSASSGSLGAGSTGSGGHPAVSYHRDAQTIRTADFRLTRHKDGYVELYDHRSDDGECQNVADQFPDVVNQLSDLLAERLSR